MRPVAARTTPGGDRDMPEEPQDPQKQSRPENGGERPGDPPADETHNDPVAGEPDVAKLRHEAASRRRQLREAEAERDALRERVDQHDREAVERIASAL